MRALRDEADVIVTNPPFSLFHDFMTWVFEARKGFIVIGSMNAIKYREVFPRLMDSTVWLGHTQPKEFLIPRVNDARGNTFALDDGAAAAKFGNICWFTNLDHAGRHDPLLLDTMAHNLKHNMKLRAKLERDFGAVGRYPRYGNFDAIEVPFVDAIPCDYKGVMGVPISFLRRHDPEQFELLGMSGDLSWASSECGFFAPPPEEVQRLCHARNKTWRVQKVYVDDPDGLPLIPVYDRLFIRSRELGGEDR